MNVTSGLGIVPLQIVPVYCATKAALHSFSVSLRRQLKDTNIKVFELIPPIVDTELDQGARDRRGQTDKGIRADVVAKKALQGIAADQWEIAVGIARVLRVASRLFPGLFLKIINKNVTGFAEK